MRQLLSRVERGLRILGLLLPPTTGTALSAEANLANWSFVPGVPGLELSRVVACGGDINGDGFSDLVIGEPYFNQAMGRVLIFAGSRGGLSSNHVFAVEGRKERSEFGRLVFSLGDVNGDGCTDVLVGGEGVLFGRRASPPELFPAWSLGYAVAIADINGDHCDDVAVRTSSKPGEEEVHIYVGSRRGLSGTPALIIRGERPGSEFGHDIVSAGDVNGDGYDDLLIGAMKFTGRFNHGGKAYLYLGSQKGLNNKPDWEAEYPLPIELGVDEEKEQFFSWGLGGGGDVNSDGFDDVIIGACFAERRDRNEGIVFLYYGSASGLSKRPDWTCEGNHPHALFGQSVANIFDVNGDGYDDVLVGVPQARDGQQEEGAVLLFMGSRKGLSMLPTWTMESDHTKEHFGEVVRSAGDINGDGYADILILGPGFERDENGKVQKFGRLVVAYGGPEGPAAPHNFQIDKPILLAAQQTFEIYRSHFGSIVYWGFPMLLLAIATGSFALVHARIRKRVYALVQENRKIAVLEERSRIARDIHDNLGADLTKIAVMAKSAVPREHFGKAASPGFEAVAISATEAIKTIDELVWATDPEHDTLESLVTFLSNFVAEFLEKNRIACRLDVPLELPDTSIGASLRHNIFLSAKEALHNVVRHAGASNVVFSVRLQDNLLTVSILDDGSGIGGEKLRGKDVNANGGRGMSHIRKRLEEIGGTAEFNSECGKGTKVMFSVPL